MILLVGLIAHASFGAEPAGAPASTVSAGRFAGVDSAQDKALADVDAQLGLMLKVPTKDGLIELVEFVGCARWKEDCANNAALNPGTGRSLRSRSSLERKYHLQLIELQMEHIEAIHKVQDFFEKDQLSLVKSCLESVAKEMPKVRILVAAKRAARDAWLTKSKKDVEAKTDAGAKQGVASPSVALRK